MLKLVWDFEKVCWPLYAQLSTAPFLCQLPLPSAPSLHPNCLINWSEILAAKSYPGWSTRNYLPSNRNWDLEIRASTYSGEEEMWPEELFKGYILTAYVQKGNNKPVSAHQGKVCKKRKWGENIVWFFWNIWRR